MESLQNAGVQTLRRMKPIKIMPNREKTTKSNEVRAPRPALPDVLATADALADQPSVGARSRLNGEPLNKEPRQKTASRQAALAEIAREVAVCQRCRELAQTRTQTVFGVGNPNSRLVFCGEAPGADEDRQGEPFVGRAGQLLNDIIVKGMQLRREDVYILNILRCRPPGNRNPLPVEAAACREYLDRQLAVIQPEFICCLGAVAAQNLLQTETPIGRLRGHVHDYHGIRVICTYHPAYLLRNPAAKKFTWDDIQFLMAEMGLNVKKKD
jgi:DNA polymerase